MKSNIKNIFAISICLLLVACNRTPDGEISWQPNSLDLTPPVGPPEYQQGWSDGCESGAQAYANSVYKTFKAFEFKYDTKLARNNMYQQIWKDAFIYCAIYWERTNQQNI
jgi:hypothetical protein